MYLTMASLFISNALGMPLTWSEQLSLLVFMIVASKGAAGVTGAGLAVLGGGLASHAPALVPGVGLIVAVDRFMSEARALTNFSGNAVATLVIGQLGQGDRPAAGRPGLLRRGPLRRPRHARRALRRRTPRRRRGVQDTRKSCAH